MAKLVLRNCFIEIDSVNFSDHISSVTVTLSKDEIDTTNFGGSGRERAHGLKDDNFELNFQQDFDAASVDATLYPLWDGETEFQVVVRPTSDPVSETNPEYSGTVILLEYTPLAGAVGELSETTVTFPAQREGIIRSTAT
ncbi:hypothetical protein J0910_00350 [Nocardiopsis sp. CNT-189]|uniref:hypothetical protein n=1 Tax=Nocardiopsis oceanisediminis TaxID=2816862 RepID=UPI003B398AC5